MSGGVSDLSTLSNDELLSLYRRGGGSSSMGTAPAEGRAMVAPPSPSSSGPDLSRMSDDDLRQLHRQVTGGSGGTSVPGADPSALPIKVRPRNAPTTVPNPFERKPEEPQAPASFGERFAGGADAPVMARSADTSSPLGQALQARADEQLIGPSGGANETEAAASGFAKPQGAGDDVGRAMQRIVDRDAQPQEVANMLYGSSRVGNTGLSVRLADRLKSTLGEDSPHWQAIQQGLISRVTDPTSPGRIVERIDDVLRGNGRVLGTRVLTAEQRAGLAAYREGVARAEAARQRVPNYLNDLAEGGFEANAVVNGLFGQGIPGARVGSATFAKAIKGLVGEGSPEWSAVRQAAVQRAMGRTESGAPLDPARTSSRLLEFTQGPGKALSRELFSAEEIGQMNRLAGALRSAYSPQGVPIPQRSEAARSAATHALNALAAGIGFKVGGPVGAGAAFGLKLGDKATSGALAARTARRSFENGAPQAYLPPPAPATQRIGAGVGAGIGGLR